MESQGNLREAGGLGASDVTGGIPLVAGSPNLGQRPPIPPAPFFNGFHGMGIQLPILLSHSMGLPIPGYGFKSVARA